MIFKCFISGWEKSAFVWSDYLDSCKAVAAPETLFDMVCGQWLLYVLGKGFLFGEMLTYNTVHKMILN